MKNKEIEVETWRKTIWRRKVIFQLLDEVKESMK